MTTSSTSLSSFADHEPAGSPHAIASARSGRAHAWWTDRCGGTSASPYESCNLALHVGDDPAAVGQNRERVADALGIGSPLVTLEQQHGPGVAHLTSMPPVPPRADAAVTTSPGLPLTVGVADCAPIALLADDAVGVVHAGWPGLLAGVIGEAVRALRRLTRQPIAAVLGPCIRPGRYEFGRADLDRLVARFGPDVEAATDWGTPALDIPAAVRIELARTGVDQLEDDGTCTSASSHLFSHRRDGVTGRQAVVAMLEL